MTAWQDSQGDAYLARSVENSFLGVSRLNEHFNDTTGICAASSQAYPITTSHFIIMSVPDDLIDFCV